MFKRAVCLGLAITIVFSVCCRQVKAEEIVEENEETVKTVDEMIESYDEEVTELDEMYKNLKITLPEEEYIWENEGKNIVNTNLARSGNTLPSGICKTGENTKTSLVGDMNVVLDNSYKYGRNGTENSFKFGEKLNKSFVLPGMEVTNVNGETCKHMVPQGITYHDGYYFITAYCGEKEHNSVIYVLDGVGNELITTLVLVGKPHAGGIAFANEYLWICATSTIYYYHYAEIKYAISCATDGSNIKSIFLGDYTYYNYGSMTLANSGEASFVTTYNGFLCIGSYQKEDETTGQLRFYAPKPVAGGELYYNICIDLPSYAQGMAFYSVNGYTYMLITTFEVIPNSKIYVYSTVGSLMNGELTFKKIIKFPCLIEEAVTRGGTTYFVFESCASKYRYLPITVVGEVCGMDSSFIYK